MFAIPSFSPPLDLDSDLRAIMIDPIEPGTEPSAASTHSAEKSAAHTPGKDDVEVDVDHKAVASIEPYQSRTVDSEKGVSTEDAVVKRWARS